MMIRTWMADVSSLFEKQNYFAHYDKVPKFRQVKADKLLSQEDKALSIGAWILFQKIQREYGLDEKVAFNLSHSGECVLCSVEDTGDSTVHVGCDLEKMRQSHSNVARRFFCEKEYQNIMALATEEDRRECFYRYWVLKESFMKATKLGMKLGMNQFEISFSDENVPILCKKPEEIEGEYYFREYSVPEKDYRVAVCADRENFATELRFIKL